MTTTQVKSSTKLGATAPEVFPIALGCMAMSGVYGKTSDDESIATIHEAIDRGINVIELIEQKYGLTEWHVICNANVQLCVDSGIRSTRK